MQLLKHKNMRTVAFMPVRVVENNLPKNIRIFGWWYCNQLEDIMGISEEINIKNWDEWTYFTKEKKI